MSNKDLVNYHTKRVFLQLTFQSVSCFIGLSSSAVLLSDPALLAMAVTAKYFVAQLALSLSLSLYSKSNNSIQSPDDPTSSWLLLLTQILRRVIHVILLVWSILLWGPLYCILYLKLEQRYDCSDGVIVAQEMKQEWSLSDDWPRIWIEHHS